MRNIAVRLRYDGTAYHGWQVQKDDVTVAGTIEKALSKMCGCKTKIVGCGRTDAGVHALKYCANFKTELAIPTERIPLALNALLPPDIAVCGAAEVEGDFNAILSCEKKEYTYVMVSARIRDPFLHNRAYFCPTPLDVPVMRRAAAQFVGTHDFCAVRSVGTETRTTVRTVHYCEIEEDGDCVSLRVCADGFLYNMVRAITGTVLYASIGKIRPEEIVDILASGDRRLAGPTVPAHGLYMTDVCYHGPAGELMAK